MRNRIEFFSKFSFIKVFAIVFSLHLIFLLFLGIHAKNTNQKPLKAVVVRNFLEKKPQLLTPKAPPIQTKEITKAQTAPKGGIPKKGASVVKPLNAPSSSSETKKVNKELTEQTLSLIKRLEEEIGSIKSDRQVASGQEMRVPSEIKEIKSQARVELDATDDSQVRLVEELQNQLHLPEYGEVCCSFRIDEEGALKELNFISYKNQENLDYLKKTLPALSFPWFNLQRVKERQFNVTFSNEIKK